MMGNEGISQETPKGGRPSAEAVRRGLRDSIIDGSLATVMGSLTGGSFLTGYALLLGADDFQIGLLSTFASLSGLIQVSGSYVVERTGDRKGLVMKAAASGRSLWIIVALLPFAFLSGLGTGRVWVMIVLLSASYTLGSILAVAWLSWMRDLVPDRIRGRYFSRRNMVMGGVGMVTTVAAGRFIDLWKGLHPDRPVMGFVIIFAFGIICGGTSLIYLSKVPEPRMQRTERSERFTSLLMLPFQNSNFFKLITFQSFWNLAVGFAGPFFSVYMIKRMGLSFTFITALSVVSSLSAIVSYRLWGRLLDRLGNKPILTIAVVGKAAFVLLWLFTTPTSTALYVVIYTMSVFDAALGLSSSNLLLKLSPREHNTIYLSAFASVSGIFAALSPTVGGALSGMLEGVRIDLGFTALEHMKFLFLISGVLRLSSLIFLRKVEEPEAKAIGSLVKSLRNVGRPKIVAGLSYSMRRLVRLDKDRHDGAGREPGHVDGRPQTGDHRTTAEHEDTNGPDSDPGRARQERDTISRLENGSC